MQSKKYVNNSELPVFNIRKVNKKATVIAKNIGEVNYFNPEADHFIDHEFQNFSSVHKVVDARKEKQMMLDQSVNQAIVNSKVYGDLKKIYLENKRKNAEHKKALEEQIERKKMQKIEALQQKQRLQNEKVKYMEAINAMKEKIYSIRQANERYRQSLNNRVSGETQYISNLIMSMRFQAEYEHGIDPDRMTYQELLELGDKIGVVSKGLPSQLIQTLPKTEVKEQSEQKCTVCFSNYEVGQIITKIFNCKHQFHFECLESWLAKQKVCPICKQEIEFGPASS